MAYLNLYSIFLFAAFIFYLFLGYSAQVFTIGPIPIAEGMILIGSLLVFFFTPYFLRSPDRKFIFIAVILIFSISMMRVLSSIEEYGFFAIRDASHFIDMTAILLGILTPISYWIRNTLFIKTFILLVFLYFALYFIGDLLPTVYNPHGGGVYLFTYITYPTLAIATSFALLIYSESLSRSHRFIVGILILIFLALIIQIFQARLIYVQLLASTLIYLYLRPSSIKYLPIFLIAGLAFLTLTSSFGGSYGRLGIGMNIDTLLDHFASMLGIESESFGHAASGVGLRELWWAKTFQDWRDNNFLFLIGKGFGMPLTDFKIAGDIVVRELHNSYLSVITRQGLFIALMVYFLWFYLLYHIFFSLKTIKQNKMDYYSSSIFLFLSLYMINVWIFSLAEDGFEKPAFSFPFYLIAGLLISLNLRHRSMH